jgi:hypothetical protein
VHWFHLPGDIDLVVHEFNCNFVNVRKMCHILNYKGHVFFVIIVRIAEDSRSQFLFAYGNRAGLRANVRNDMLLP